MTKFSDFAPIKGNPPSIEWRALDELHIDESYQRTANDRAVNAIAHSWDWRLCAPLTVSRRGDPATFFVIDGQHRLEAARRRGDIAHLPCIISVFLAMSEEANCFVAVNTRRQRVSPLETFRAELAAGDPKAMQVARIVADAGLSIARHSNPGSWKVGQISSIQGIKGALFRHGETVARAALEDLKAAFPNDVLRFSGRILAALYELHAKPPPHFDRARLRAGLKMKSQADWNAAMLRRQARYGETQGSAMEYAIRDACGFN